ncbi:MAG: ribonuclease domain-containing protein [Propionibacteriaceae bacterium]
MKIQQLLTKRVLAVVLLLATTLGLGTSAIGVSAAPAFADSGVSAKILATDPESGLEWIKVSSLPKEAKETLVLIDRGGPFPYPGKDGSIYRNRSKALPDEEIGYYHEYTVKTPGASNRGARRIITGSNGEFYWTSDHYSTFKRIQR